MMYTCTQLYHARNHVCVDFGIADIVSNEGRWVSEGMKCWLAHCMARRAAKACSLTSSRTKSRAATRHSCRTVVEAVEEGEVSGDGQGGMHKAVEQILSFIDDGRGGAGGLNDGGEEAGGISARQRVCCQVHLSFLYSRMGDHGASGGECLGCACACACVGVRRKPLLGCLLSRMCTGPFSVLLIVVSA